MELKNIIEALIFVTPEPVSTCSLVRCLRPDLEDSAESEEESSTPRPSGQDVEKAIEELNRGYEAHGQAFRIVAEAGGWRFLSHPDFAPWIERMVPDRKPARLSPAALETLAIIAYRQPVTKSGVEAIRGVGIDGVLQSIMDRGLVHAIGRAALPGKPLLYGTTSRFLEHFGIRDLDELPQAEELRFTPIPALIEMAAESVEKKQGNRSKSLSLVAAARKLTESQEHLSVPVDGSPHP